MFKKITHAVALLLVTIYLSGCHSPSKETYFIHHPAKLKSILTKCNAMPIAQARKEAQCFMAMRTYLKIVQLNSELESNPQAYGKKVLALQVQRGKLQVQRQTVIKLLTHKSISHHAKYYVLQQQLQKLNSQISMLTNEINMRIALLTLVEGM